YLLHIYLQRPHVLLRTPSGKRLNPPHSRSDRRLAGNENETHIPRPLAVSASAKLSTEAGHNGIYLDDPPFFTVLLAEELEDVFLPHGFVERREPRVYGQVLPDLLIDQPLDLRQLLGSHRLRVRKVEAQPVWRHQRPGLLDMR